MPSSDHIALLRTLDAAANRAEEGLRVVEDYLRFVLDDAHLTRLCKQVRHDLADALRAWPLADRLAARETRADVGATGTIAGQVSSGAQGQDLRGLVTANFKRAQQAIRTLEELAKVVLPGATAGLSSSVSPASNSSPVAQALEQLRYRCYTLQRAVELTASSSERLAAARLYVLVDGCESEASFRRLAEAVIRGGANVLQLRDKQLADRELVARAHLLRELTRSTGVLFIVNDRPDLAVLCQADGVHVGQDELSVKDARTIVGPQALVGVSAHSLEQAREAVLDGANYIGVGPTFPSATKRFEQFPGIELLQAVQAELKLPAFAIGGINLANVEAVLRTGFTRIAVGSAITQAADPEQATRSFAERL